MCGTTWVAKPQTGVRFSPPPTERIIMEDIDKDKAVLANSHTEIIAHAQAIDIFYECERDLIEQAAHNRTQSRHYWIAFKLGHAWVDLFECWKRMRRAYKYEREARNIKYSIAKTFNILMLWCEYIGLESIYPVTSNNQTKEDYLLSFLGTIDDEQERYKTKKDYLNSAHPFTTIASRMINYITGDDNGENTMDS